MKGNFTTSDFTSAEVSFSQQLNSTHKMTSDLLKYSNGYIEDLYTDVIEGLDVNYVILFDFYGKLGEYYDRRRSLFDFFCQ